MQSGEQQAMKMPDQAFLRKMRTIKQRITRSKEPGRFLREFTKQCIDGQKLEDLYQFLLSFDYIEAKLELLKDEQGVTQCLSDYERAIGAISDPEAKRMLAPLAGAIRLSAKALEKDPLQLFAQLYSRLLNEEMPALRALIGGYTSTHTWLRMLSKTMISWKEPLFRQLDGHHQTISDCVISMGGKKVLTASGDGDLRFWDVETGQSSILRGHTEKVNSCSLSADTSLALSASTDGTLRLWDLETGMCLKVFSGHEGQVTDCVLSRDGKRCVSSSIDKTVRVWDLSKDESTSFVLAGHEDIVTCCALSADGKMALSGAFDQTLRLWDLETHTCVRTIENDGGITRCALSPDGRFAYSNWRAYFLDMDEIYAKSVVVEEGSSDYQCWLFYNSGNFDQERMTGHYFDDLLMLITSIGDLEVLDKEHTLHMWELSSGEHINTFEGYATIDDFDLSHDGTFLISETGKGTFKVWSTLTGECLMTLPTVSEGITACTINDTGNTAVTGYIDGSVCVWDLAHTPGQAGEKEEIFVGRAISDCGYSQDGSHAYSVDDRAIRVWNVAAGDLIATYNSYILTSEQITVSIDPLKAIVTPAFLVPSKEETKDLRVIDLETGQEIATLSGHTQRPNYADLDRSGKAGLSASHDGTLRAWDVEKQQCISVMSGHVGRIMCCALSADGSRALSGSDDATLRIWDTQTGTSLHILSKHTGSVSKCVFSEDAYWALSFGEEGTICFWDTHAGTLVQQLSPLAILESFNPIQLSRSGKLAAYGASETLYLVNPRTAELITAFSFDTTFNTVAFSPDEASLIVGDHSGRLHFLLIEEGRPEEGRI